MAGKSKYQVGYEFSNKKRLTKLVGSHKKFRTLLWMWECTSCGKEYGPSLTNSITRSKEPKCCSSKRLYGFSNPNGRGYEKLSGVWLGQRKTDAAKRGYEWSVTPEYLWQLWLEQRGKCWYTGRELTLYDGKSGSTASLDRTDNSIGYVEGNVRWVHTDVNRMKSNMELDDFLQVCYDIASYR